MAAQIQTPFSNVSQVDIIDQPPFWMVIEAALPGTKGAVAETRSTGAKKRKVLWNVNHELHNLNIVSFDSTAC